MRAAATQASALLYSEPLSSRNYAQMKSSLLVLQALTLLSAVAHVYCYAFGTMTFSVALSLSTLCFNCSRTSQFLAFMLLLSALNVAAFAATLAVSLALASGNADSLFARRALHSCLLYVFDLSINVWACCGFWRVIAYKTQSMVFSKMSFWPEADAEQLGAHVPDDDAEFALSVFAL